MSFARGSILVCAFAIGFGIVGGLAGPMLGSTAPQPLRSFLAAVGRAEFGVGTACFVVGAIVGTACGIAAGCGFLAGARRARAGGASVAPATDDPDFPRADPAASYSRRPSASPFGSIMKLVAVVAAMFFGGISNEAYRSARVTAERISRVHSICDDPRFAELAVRHSGDGWPYLRGTVDSRKSLDVLKERLGYAFGEGTAEFMTREVQAAEEGTEE